MSTPTATPLTFVLSDESLNSQGFRVLTNGIDLSSFKKNPLMLWMHFRPWQGTTDELLPIGTWQNIRIEGDRLLADAVFDQEDEFAQRIQSKVEQGILKMCSIGAMPISTSEDTAVMVKGQTRPTVIKCLLKEVSICDIGANHNSLKLYDDYGREIELSDCDLLPELNQNNIQEMNLTDVASAIGIAEPHSEEVVLTALRAMKAENDKYKQNEEAMRLTARDTLIGDAIKARKITESQRSLYEKLYDADAESTREALIALKGVENPAPQTQDGSAPKVSSLERRQQEVVKNLKGSSKNPLK